MIPIDAKALKEAVDTWDKFGYTAQGELIRLTEKNKDLYVPYVKYQDIVNCIDNAPTIDPDMAQVLAYESGKASVERLQGQWIPVSERLPKEEDYRPCWGLPDGCVMWQTDNGDIGFGWYYDSTKCWSDIHDHPIKAGKVITWRPLPEPYKKGGAE